MAKPRQCQIRKATASSCRRPMIMFSRHVKRSTDEYAVFRTSVVISELARLRLMWYRTTYFCVHSGVDWKHMGHEVDQHRIAVEDEDRGCGCQWTLPDHFDLAAGCDEKVIGEHSYNIQWS